MLVVLLVAGCAGVELQVLQLFLQSLQLSALCADQNVVVTQRLVDCVPCRRLQAGQITGDE